ncbi:MAG: hypothetical protein CALGDGBN_03157 [Pseudomonadales bacterium]|nr:hypothetical protein [Pseudomonadales bacterium]
MLQHVAHRPPRTVYALLEFARAVNELASLLPANRWLAQLPGGDGHPVVTLPGFGGADGSTALMRRYITRWGYEAHPWPLGRNMDPAATRDMSGVLEFMDGVVTAMGEQLHRIHRRTKRRASLVGWSLGGLYSRQIAARFPDLVRQVVTLGTPFGDPRATIVWPIMRRLVDSPEPGLEDMRRWMAMARVPIEVPLSVIWSRSDGFVHPSIACQPEGPFTENIHVCGSHMGFGSNPLAFYVMADRLSQPENGWQPFERSGWRRLLFGGRPVNG